MKRDLTRRYYKVMEELADRGYKVHGTKDYKRRVEFVCFYEKNPKLFWDFFEIPEENLISDSLAQLAELLGARKEWFAAAFRVRFGETWVKRRKRKMLNYVKSRLRGGYSRASICRRLAEDFNVSEAWAAKFVYSNFPANDPRGRRKK